MQELKEWIKSFVIALIIVMPISYFVRPAMVEGASMQPTLYNNNIVIMERNVKDLKLGDVVVFDGRPIEDFYLIKRVIGLPGDFVEIKDGFVYVNGNKLQETYLEDSTITEPSLVVKVPKDEIFVLGDNREISEDSRYIGTIPIKKIKGHVYLRVFPLNQVEKF